MKNCISLLLFSLSFHVFAQTEPISPLYNPSQFASNAEDSENPFYLGLTYTNGMNAYRLFGNKHEMHTGYKAFILSPNLLNDSLEKHDFRIGISADVMLSKGLRSDKKNTVPNVVYTDNEGAGAALFFRYTAASKTLKPYIELAVGLRSNSSSISAYNETIDSTFSAYCDRDYLNIGLSGGSQITIIEHKLKLDIKLTYLGGINVEHFNPTSPAVNNNTIQFQAYNKPLSFLQFDMGILISFEALRDINKALNIYNRGLWY